MRAVADKTVSKSLSVGVSQNPFGVTKMIMLLQMRLSILMKEDLSVISSTLWSAPKLPVSGRFAMVLSSRMVGNHSKTDQ